MSKVVLFDFDGVLIRGDCYARLLRDLIESSPWRRAAALAAAPVMLPLLASPWKRPALRGFVRIATQGRATQELEAALASATAAAAARWVEPAWAALDAHRAAGDRVIIVTGAGDMLAKRLITARGRGDVELIASPILSGPAGWTAQRHCYGPEKVRMLAELGIEPPWDVAYSDSAADLPMLSGAKRAVLVSPGPRAEAVVLKALPGIEVVRW